MFKLDVVQQKYVPFFVAHSHLVPSFQLNELVELLFGELLSVAPGRVERSLLQRVALQRGYKLKICSMVENKGVHEVGLSFVIMDSS